MAYNIDLEKIAQELEFDLEDVEMLLEVFLDSAKESLEDLKNGIEENNMETIFSSSHAIKGSAANILLNEISQLAKEIEVNARNNNEINYKEEYEKLRINRIYIKQALKYPTTLDVSSLASALVL